jgi:hypothetical protein
MVPDQKSRASEEGAELKERRSAIVDRKCGQWIAIVDIRNGLYSVLSPIRLMRAIACPRPPTKPRGERLNKATRPLSQFWGASSNSNSITLFLSAVMMQPWTCQGHCPIFASVRQTREV